MNQASQPANQLDCNTSKKKLLLTRKKLWSRLNDPPGLLNLVDSSTNGSERSKKLELLKTAGRSFETTRKSSFNDKLNAASIRLGVGMGAHSIANSLPFLSRYTVFSSPEECLRCREQLCRRQNQLATPDCL